jgi:hypothetical protein
MRECRTERRECRGTDIARVLRLVPNKRSPGDWAGDCPACGHGGFALSQPTLTKMRNIWSCNCKTCNGGKGCPARITRVAMIGKGIPAGCLGTYIGKDHAEIQPEAARLMTQTIDDILAAPGLKPADIRIALAEARGRKIPEDFAEFVLFAISIGIGRASAYSTAARWCPGSRPSDEYPPQTGGEGSNSSSTSTTRNRVKPPRSEPRNRPKIGLEQSKNWTETAPSAPPGSPNIGQPTSRGKPGRKVA